jgi:hypothetical protein
MGGIGVERYRDVVVDSHRHISSESYGKALRVLSMVGELRQDAIEKDFRREIEMLLGEKLPDMPRRIVDQIGERKEHLTIVIGKRAGELLYFYEADELRDRVLEVVGKSMERNSYVLRSVEQISDRCIRMIFTNINLLPIRRT